MSASEAPEAGSPRFSDQLRVTGVLDTMGENNVYEGTTFLGETTRTAYDDALAWVERNRAAESPDDADASEPDG